MLDTAAKVDLILLTYANLRAFLKIVCIVWGFMEIHFPPKKAEQFSNNLLKKEYFGKVKRGKRPYPSNAITDNTANFF